MKQQTESIERLNERVSRKIQRIKESMPTAATLEPGQIWYNLSVLDMIAEQRSYGFLIKKENVPNHTSLVNPNDKRTKRRPLVALCKGSTGNLYEVKAHEFWGLSCECKGFRFHKHCKHIKAVGDKVKVL